MLSNSAVKVFRAKPVFHACILHPRVPHLRVLVPDTNRTNSRQYYGFESVGLNQVVCISERSRWARRHRRQKPRREAASEPGGKRVSKFVSCDLR